MDNKAVKIFYAGGFLYSKDTKSVLLHLRDGNTQHNPHKWALFGGRNEGDELPEETFIREINEELGIIIKKEDLRYLCDYLNTNYGTWRYIYYIESSLDKSAMVLSEGADFDWVSLDKVFEYDLEEKTRNDLGMFRKSLL